MMPLRQKHCKFYRVNYGKPQIVASICIFICVHICYLTRNNGPEKLPTLFSLSSQEKMDKLLQFFHSYKHMHFVCLYTQNMLFKFRHNITCLCCLACPICYSLHGHQGYINNFNSSAKTHRLQFSQQRDPVMLLLSVVSQPPSHGESSC